MCLSQSKPKFTEVMKVVIGVCLMKDQVLTGMSSLAEEFSLKLNPNASLC